MDNKNLMQNKQESKQAVISKQDTERRMDSIDTLMAKIDGMLQAEKNAQAGSKEEEQIARKRENIEKQMPQQASQEMAKAIQKQAEKKAPARERGAVDEATKERFLRLQASARSEYEKKLEVANRSVEMLPQKMDAIKAEIVSLGLKLNEVQSSRQDTARLNAEIQIQIENYSAYAMMLEEMRAKKAEAERELSQLDLYEQAPLIEALLVDLRELELDKDKVENRFWMLAQLPVVDAFRRRVESSIKAPNQWSTELRNLADQCMEVQSRLRSTVEAMLRNAYEPLEEQEGYVFRDYESFQKVLHGGDMGAIVRAVAEFDAYYQSLKASGKYINRRLQECNWLVEDTLQGILIREDRRKAFLEELVKQRNAGLLAMNDEALGLIAEMPKNLPMEQRENVAYSLAHFGKSGFGVEGYDKLLENRIGMLRAEVEAMEADALSKESEENRRKHAEMKPLVERTGKTIVGYLPGGDAESYVNARHQMVLTRKIEESRIDDYTRQKASVQDSLKTVHTAMESFRTSPLCSRKLPQLVRAFLSEDKDPEILSENTMKLIEELSRLENKNRDQLTEDPRGRDLLRMREAVVKYSRTQPKLMEREQELWGQVRGNMMDTKDKKPYFKELLALINYDEEIKQAMTSLKERGREDRDDEMNELLREIEMLLHDYNSAGYNPVNLLRSPAERQEAPLPEWDALIEKLALYELAGERKTMQKYGIPYLVENVHRMLYRREQLMNRLAARVGAYGL